MNFIRFNISHLTVVLMLVLTSCLPVQKETQCGNNEAFNATQRKCVPVVGSASTNTVFVKSKSPSNSYTAKLGDSAQQHSVAVSDVYNYGYSTQWNIRFTSSVSSIYNFSSDSVQLNTLSYNFLPPSTSNPQLAGSYVIECIILDQDASVQLDSVTWTVQVGAEATPVFQNEVPASGAVTYSSNSNSETLSVEISNPDNQSGLLTWYVNSVAVQGPSFFNGATDPLTSATDTNLAYTVDPENDLGAGIHTIEARSVQLTDPSIIFDSQIWYVNVVDPDLPSISSATPAFSESIINIDGVDYSSGGYLDSSYTDISSIGTGGLCVTVDDYDKDGDSIGDLDYSLDINGNTFVSAADYGANEVCVSTVLLGQTLVNSQVGESKTITFKTYKKGTATVVEQRTWSLVVQPKNTTPKISINVGDSSIGCSTIVEDTLSATGCTMTQSVDDDEDGTYGTTLPEVNNEVTIAINFQDYETFEGTAAHNEDEIEVIFQLRKSGDLNFNDVDSTNTYSVNDCYYESSSSKAAVKGSNEASGYDNTYMCTLGINAFDLTSNGTIEEGTYEIKAKVRDAGSVWAPGNIQESNEVSWTVSVSEPTNNVAAVSAQVTAAPGATDSYVELSNSACTLAGTVLDNVTANANENDYIRVHTLIRDSERDDLQISLRMSNGVSGGESTVQALTTVTTAYDDSGYVDHVSCFQIPEWAVDGSVGTTSASVSIIPDIVECTDGAGCTVDTTSTDATFQIMVGNDNPIPQLADATDVVLSPSDSALTAGSDIIVYAGYPFEIDPPSYTDASVIDGDNVEWQWQICIGDTTADCDPDADYDNVGVPTNPAAEWVNISNANNTGDPISENLVWTPSPRITAGSNINLRLCLGDDGGNPSDCRDVNSGTYAGSYKVYQNIKAFPSQVVGTAYSQAELGSWYDETDDILYTATTSGTQIVATKYVRSTTAGEKQWVLDHEIFFDTEEPTKTSGIATELSVTGIDQTSFFISYLVTDQVTSAPQARVRRIDLTNTKFSFNYGGLFNGTGDANDMVTTEPADVNTTSSTTGNAQLVIDFSAHGAAGTVNPDAIDFLLADGTAVSIAFCAGTCAGDIAAATDLETALNANATIAKELLVTNGGNSLTISGPPSNDFSDFGGISVTLGDIVVDDVANRWYVPYASTSSLNVYYGGNANLDMTNFVAASQVVPGAGSVNQEIASAIDSSQQVVIATKNSGGNLSVYRIDNTFALVDSDTNVFTFAGSEEISGISVSTGASDDVYVACKNYNSSTGETLLGLAAMDGTNIATNASENAVNDTNFLAQDGLEEVRVVGHPTDDGVAILAIRTSNTHGDIPDEAHLFKMVQADTITFGGAPQLASYNSSTTNLTSPALNVGGTAVSSTAISVSHIFNYTVGHVDTSSVAATEDSVETAMIFSFHETSGIVHGMYNIDEENMSTDSTASDGSFPSYVEN